MTAAAGTTATVSGAVTVSVANSIAGANNVQAAFTNGITAIASDGNPGPLQQDQQISDDSTSMTAACQDLQQEQDQCADNARKALTTAASTSNDGITAAIAS